MSIDLDALVDELLDTLDSIDDGSELTVNQKRLILSSLGAGEIGDKWPITAENIRAWKMLRDEYDRLQDERGEYADSLRILLESSTFELIYRCFTSNSSAYLFRKISARWKL